MNDHQAKEFAEAVYTNIWSGKDLSKFDDYYHRDIKFVCYQPNGGETQLDYELIKKHAYEMKFKRKDVETNFQEVIGHENKIFARFEQRSICVDTGNVFHLRTAFRYELIDGKIKNGWAFFNHRINFLNKN